jgi:DUF4097 and DUF4098 domain-containing protein YvlB
VPSGPGLDRSDIPMPLPGRPLWTIFGTIIAVAGLGWGAFNVIDLLAHGETTEDETFAAEDVSAISIDNDNGRVVVVGSDTEIVSLHAEISHGLRDTGFDWEVVDGVLEVEGHCPLFGSYWCDVAYRLEVPRDVDVVINSDNDRVTVSDVDGDVQINADNGRVELVRLSGMVHAETDNGRVEGDGLTSDSVTAMSDNGRVELDFADAPSFVSAETDNGSIDIALPEVEEGYNVDTQTDNGSEDVAVLDNPSSPRTVEATTDNGSITVRPIG